MKNKLTKLLKPKTESDRGISRRKMISNSIGGLVSVAALGTNEIFAAEKKQETNPKVNFSPSGKSAIVTGAARGIGRAIVAVVFLASDPAYRITGATYDVTAGDSAKYTA